jgi:hypothetical protein
MASVGKAVAQSGAISGGSGTSAVLSLEQFVTDLIPTVQVSALGAGTTLAVTFQHSPEGTYWKDVVALQNVSGGTTLAVAGILLKELANTSPVYGNVRFSWTLTGGTTTATAIFSVYYDKRR